MRFFIISGPLCYALFFTVGLGLAGCGTKPKELKSDQPFPVSYLQAETPPPAPNVAPAAAPQTAPTNPSLQRPVPISPTVN